MINKRKYTTFTLLFVVQGYKYKITDGTKRNID